MATSCAQILVSDMDLNFVGIQLLTWRKGVKMNVVLVRAFSASEITSKTPVDKGGIPDSSEVSRIEDPEIIALSLMERTWKRQLVMTIGDDSREVGAGVRRCMGDDSVLVRIHVTHLVDERFCELFLTFVLSII